jgi:hypothetical protein
MGWTTKKSWFDCRYGKGIYLFFKASRPALGTTQPPDRWVPEAFFRGLKRSGREDDHSPHLLPRLKMSVSAHPFSHAHSWRAQAQLNVHHLQLLPNICVDFLFPTSNLCTMSFLILLLKYLLSGNTIRIAKSRKVRRAWNNLHERMRRSGSNVVLSPHGIRPLWRINCEHGIILKRVFRKYINCDVN